MSTYTGVTNCDSSLVDEIWHVKLRVVVVVVVLKTVSFLAHPVYAILACINSLHTEYKASIAISGSTKCAGYSENYIKTSR